MIRSKVTGLWLGHTPRRNKTSASLSNRVPPRLFTTRSGAQQALDWWSEGVYFIGYDEDGIYDLNVSRRPERDKGEMEILEVELKSL